VWRDGGWSAAVGGCERTTSGSGDKLKKTTNPAVGLRQSNRRVEWNSCKLFVMQFYIRFVILFSEKKIVGTYTLCVSIILFSNFYLRNTNIPCYYNVY